MTRISLTLLALTLSAPPALAQHVHDHAPAPTPAPAIAPDHGTMDHSVMDHSGMDHSGMDHGQMSHPATPSAAPSALPETPASGPRDPHAYASGYDNEPMSAHHMAPPRTFLLLVDKLEYQGNTRSADGLAWDIQGWSGGDIDRLGWRSEGAAAGHEVEAAVEVFWARAVSPFWEVQAGIRQDVGDGPERGWLGIGIEGLAPYWFDVRASLYAGPSGRLAARLNVEYELLLTQRLVLTPELEADAYSETDRARGIGRGLSEVTLGARLRYEFRREFAPYVGVSWTAKLGRTADLARADGASPREAAVVAGVRFWF
ncbi:copper resistance protein B [Parapedomonas caeni]